MELYDIIPTPRYLTQRDNKNPFTGKPDANNQCMVATFTMLANWLGDKLNIPELQNYTEIEHLTLVGKNLQEIESRRYNSSNHAEVINQKLKSLKLPQKLVSGVFNWIQVKNIAKEKKSPVEVGSMVTKSGHIILYIGNNKWHDSNGKCSEKTLAYNGEGFTTDGSNVEYSEKFVLERIFRNADAQGKTIKTNVARTCWYYTGL
jgi:hypothetical protein